MIGLSVGQDVSLPHILLQCHEESLADRLIIILGVGVVGWMMVRILSEVDVDEREVGCWMERRGRTRTDAG